MGGDTLDSYSIQAEFEVQISGPWTATVYM